MFKKGMLEWSLLISQMSEWSNLCFWWTENNNSFKIKKWLFSPVSLDEIKDISKKEHLTLTIQYLHVKERAIDNYQMWKICTDSLANFIYDKVCSMRLHLKFCVGQCYDSANIMNGWTNGVQARIKEKALHVGTFTATPTSKTLL